MLSPIKKNNAEFSPWLGVEIKWADIQPIGCNFLLYETLGMIAMINVADLKDPSDPQGRTYREINNATQHAFAVGDLVELENGARLFVAKQTRDCDGTPLYSLTYKIGGEASLHGFSEYGMERV